ncbi:hypothetical protein BDU57DRAFT_262076 [Ampelomyces quisqualis]|uniref:Uncharacterized protein n=1 Tax=Ampelomyces quisqualis TaxID=50730 RepID=A0A6A5QHV1_AMPQU|nr:hypothetical protein BDU57DRAFT_262076 [Ampelomyces quisqualis]
MLSAEEKASQSSSSEGSDRYVGKGGGWIVSLYFFMRWDIGFFLLFSRFKTLGGVHGRLGVRAWSSIEKTNRVGKLSEGDCGDGIDSIGRLAYCLCFPIKMGGGTRATGSSVEWCPNILSSYLISPRAASRQYLLCDRDKGGYMGMELHMMLGFVSLVFSLSLHLHDYLYRQTSFTVCNVTCYSGNRRCSSCAGTFADSAKDSSTNRKLEIASVDRRT